MQFLIFQQFKTPLLVNDEQHKITTIYISTLTYEKDPVDLKCIPSQTDNTEQRFSEDKTVHMLISGTILYHNLIRNK